MVRCERRRAVEITPFEFPLILVPMPPPYHYMFTASDLWPEGATSSHAALSTALRVGVLISEVLAVPGRSNAKIVLVSEGSYVAMPDVNQPDPQGENNTVWLQLLSRLETEPDAVVAHEVAYKKQDPALVFTPDGHAITNAQIPMFNLGLPLSLTVADPACDEHPPIVVWPMQQV